MLELTESLGLITDWPEHLCTVSWAFPWSGLYQQNPTSAVQCMTFSFSHRVYLCSNQYQKMEACSFEGWGNVGRGDVIHCCGFKVTVFITPAQTVFVVLASIFKCLREQFSPYFKFNFPEINSSCLSSQPASTPTSASSFQFVPPPNSPLYASGLTSQTTEATRHKSSLTQTFPSPATCNPLPFSIFKTYLQPVISLLSLQPSLSNPPPQYFT